MELALDCAGNGCLTPHPADDLSREFSILYGLPVDMARKHNTLSTIANALNCGNLALAKIASVQMGFPDLPRFSTANENIEKLGFLLRRGGLLKEEWDPAKHPRWPAGSPDGQGGEFSPADEGSAGTQNDQSIHDGQTPTVSDRCAEEWGQAREFCEGLEKRGLMGTFGHLSFGRTYEQCVRGMVSAACGGNPVG